VTERSILITGCSSGIGQACAIGMKARGWRVFATARRDVDLQALEVAGLEAVYLDYADPASIAACAETVLAATGGRLDALFNNGAYGQPGAVEDLPMDVLRAQFEANFFGWHDLTNRMIPTMRRQGHGRIVQCSSVLGLVTLSYRGAYAASKFALEGLSNSLKLELRGSGIFVSLIEPGPIATKFVATSLTAFENNIDIEASVHQATYRRRLERLRRGGASRGKLGPEAVLKALVHAVEHRRPKPHYYVTIQTHIMALLRRLLPNRLFDFVLARISDAES